MCQIQGTLCAEKTEGVLPVFPKFFWMHNEAYISRRMAIDVIYREKYEQWIRAPWIDEATRAELAALTDEKEILDAIGRVRRVYPNVMELAFDRADREEAGRRAEEAFAAQLQSPPELFELFYERQNGCEMEAAQRELLKEIWEDLGEQAGGREQ